MSATTDQPAKRRLRTWSAFGDIKRRPSDYEIGTQGMNYTLREGRKAPFEQNPSSPANLWMQTYRDDSPLQVDDWESFRDPDMLSYRAYVTQQHEQETKVGGVLEQYAAANADAQLPPEWRATLARLFTTTRYPLHGAQQVQAYIGLMAPSPYITNPAALSAADMLRRVTLVSYRTRELQLAWPDDGFATGERAIWELDEAWQPTRRAIELALTAYDWGEAFTAMNLVLLPSLDDVLLRQLGEVARDSGDDLTWLLTSFLQRDAQRRERWSGELARFVVAQRPGNAGVLRKWIDKWSPLADESAAGLGSVLENYSLRGRAASEVAAAAAAARERLLAGASPGLASADPAAAS
ncbi:MAG: toluene hydroxylase [Pseudonocardiales bacterium]|nr:toluene hydroxylase [Pseudonocardiales bacterium]MBV9649367.1 toluene hydroxylase [Pseudonocardiales bacterium]